MPTIGKRRRDRIWAALGRNPCAEGNSQDALEKINQGIVVATGTKKFQEWAANAGGGTTKLPSVADAQKIFEEDRVMWQETVKTLGLSVAKQ